MYPKRIVRHALGLALSMTLVVCSLSTCGGGQEQASKPRPLPEDEKALRPGVYRSEEFKPSLSFRVGKGWTNMPPEASDVLTIRRAHEPGGLGFVNIRQVHNYNLTRTNPQYVVKAPENMVGWFQHHPYLQTDKPKSVTVGGVKGKQLDVVVENLPEDNPGLCGSHCVDIFELSTGSQVWLGEGYKFRFIIFEDMKGETVAIGFARRATEFDEYAPEAQKVIDTVEWGG